MPGIKPWSLSTVRNPYRLRGFLSALAEIEGEIWNPANQVRFQILLTQRYWSDFADDGLVAEIGFEGLIELSDGEYGVPFAVAERIFFSKGYANPPMRGRVSFKNLERLGFATINPVSDRVQITPLGRELMNPECDIGDVILRCLLKWQLPNPLDRQGLRAVLGYEIKPFVGALHLINQVDNLCKEKGLTETGLSFDEFDAFVVTLIDWEAISKVAEKLVDIRIACRGLSGAENESRRKNLTEGYLKDFNLKHLKAYGDNTRRYFRLTRFIRFSGSGRTVDLEPHRGIEIEAILRSDNARPWDFLDKQEYHAYLCNPNLPILPWQNSNDLTKIYLHTMAGIMLIDPEKGRQLQSEYPLQQPSP